MTCWEETNKTIPRGQGTSTEGSHYRIPGLASAWGAEVLGVQGERERKREREVLPL